MLLYHAWGISIRFIVGKRVNVVPYCFFFFFFKKKKKTKKKNENLSRC
jgi:hypothetical protein